MKMCWRTKGSNATVCNLVMMFSLKQIPGSSWESNKVLGRVNEESLLYTPLYPDSNFQTLFGNYSEPVNTPECRCLRLLEGLCHRNRDGLSLSRMISGGNSEDRLEGREHMFPKSNLKCSKCSRATFFAFGTSLRSRYAFEI